jgi:hypothetical protein
VEVGYDRWGGRIVKVGRSVARGIAPWDPRGHCPRLQKGHCPVGSTRSLPAPTEGALPRGIHAFTARAYRTGIGLREWRDGLYFGRGETADGGLAAVGNQLPRRKKRRLFPGGVRGSQRSDDRLQAVGTSAMVRRMREAMA